MTDVAFVLAIAGVLTTAILIARRDQRSDDRARAARTRLLKELEQHR